MANPAYLVWQEDDTEEIRFDAVLSESHELMSEVTENAVEKGSNVTDHVRKSPERLSLEVFIGNHPNTEIDGGEFKVLDLEIPQYQIPLAPTPGSLTRNAVAVVEGIGSAISDLISGAPTLTTLQFSKTLTRYKVTVEKLSKIRDKAILLRAITAIREYENLILERFAPVKTPDDGDGYTISLDMRVIRIVETKLVKAPLIAVPRANLKIPKGIQNPLDGEGKSTKSLLKKLTDSLEITGGGPSVDLGI